MPRNYPNRPATGEMLTDFTAVGESSNRRAGRVPDPAFGVTEVAGKGKRRAAAPVSRSRRRRAPRRNASLARSAQSETTKPPPPTIRLLSGDDFDGLEMAGNRNRGLEGAKDQHCMFFCAA